MMRHALLAVTATIGSLAASAPTGAAAQTVAPLPSSPAAPEAHVLLKQLTLRLETVPDPEEQARRVAQFQAAAKAMVLCEDAEGVAKDLGLDPVVTRDVPLSAVPEALRQELATMRVGTATRMFGQRDVEASVLVLCGRAKP